MYCLFCEASPGWSSVDSSKILWELVLLKKVRLLWFSVKIVDDDFVCNGQHASSVSITALAAQEVKVVMIYSQAMLLLSRRVLPLVKTGMAPGFCFNYFLVCLVLEEGWEDQKSASFPPLLHFQENLAALTQASGVPPKLIDEFVASWTLLKHSGVKDGCKVLRSHQNLLCLSNQALNYLCLCQEGEGGLLRHAREWSCFWWLLKALALSATAPVSSAPLRDFGSSGEEPPSNPLFPLTTLPISEVSPVVWNSLGF